MTGIPVEFMTYAYKTYDRVLQMQPEVGLPDVPLASTLSVNLATWGYWAADSRQISLYKYLENRHLVNICNRWARDHTIDIQQSWLNGIGFESWENVWGIFMPMRDRDAEATRRVGTMGRFLNPILTSPNQFLPHTVTEVQSTFSTLFIKKINSTDPLEGLGLPLGTVVYLWTLISTASSDTNQTIVIVPIQGEDLQFIDCYHGQVFKPAIINSSYHLSVYLEDRAYGCIMALSANISRLPDRWMTFLSLMAALTSKPLSSFSEDVKYLQQRHIAIPLTPGTSATPAGMILINGTTPSSPYQFIVSGVEIEGGNSYVDVQYTLFNETLAKRYHNLSIRVTALYIDIYPVTRSNWATYLTDSSYMPTDSKNYLIEWNCTRTGKCVYPTGTDDLPVTSISYYEALSFCQFYKKRLPEEWEWQYAAQGGNSSQSYPWGDQNDPTRVPKKDSSQSPRTVESVSAHPTGRSSTGLYDLVGNKWEWTSQFRDDHTRRAILKGGSLYHPTTSQWYFPPVNERLDLHGHLLMMSNSMDRNRYTGFRCVADVIEEPIYHHRKPISE